MTKKYIFIILLMLVFAVSSGCGRKSPERAFPKPHFRHSHGEDSKDYSKFEHSRVDRMAKDLGLSEQQIEELKKLEMEITEKRIEMKHERKRREDVKVKIVEMVKEDSLSREEILNFMNELHSLGEESRKEADIFIAERLAKMHSIFTKEQREKLAKKIEEFDPERRFKHKKDTE
jgi:hypothetical protein